MTMFLRCGGSMLASMLSFFTAMLVPVGRYVSMRRDACNFARATESCVAIFVFVSRRAAGYLDP